MTGAPAFPEDHPALAPERPFDDAALEAEYQREYGRLLSPKRGGAALLLLVTLAAFALAQLGADRSLSSLAMLAVVLGFHELGHFAGMRLFGYRDVRMFFIPFLGAAVSGKKVGVARWKEGVVLLLGPVPGLLLGAALLVAGLRTPHPTLHSLAFSLIVINGLNLLPVAPLDGGRLFQMLLFSRNRFLEVAFLGVAAAVLGMVAVRTGTWALLALAFLLVITLPFRYRVLRAAPAARDLPADPSLLSPADARRLFTLARAAMPKPSRGRPRQAAAAMEQVLDAAQPPPRWGATSALLGAWTAALIVLALCLGLLGLAAPAKWSEHRSEPGGFAILMPRAPVVTRIDSTILEQARQGTDRIYAVRWSDRPIPPRGAFGVISESTVPLAGGSAHELKLRRQDGALVVIRSLQQGGRSFEIAATVPREDAETRRFLDSFRLLR